MSGHSTFSAAAAQGIRSFTGPRYFDAGSLFVEPGTVPATAVQPGWSTFPAAAAAAEAGLSREHGGIHFRDADALNLGRAVGTNAWNKAQTYFQDLAAG